MCPGASSHVKFSRMESLVNNCIYVILAFLILMSLIASANKQIASTLLTEHWYLQFEDSTTILPGWGGKFVSDFLTFLILFYNFVPLSVYITMEAVNLFHAFFIDWDAAMYDVRSDTAAHARTAALSEDLGQIEYIFSDKTGTLTQNAMVFRACTIAPSRGRSVAPDGAAAEGVVSDGAQGSEGRTYGKVSLFLCTVVILLSVRVLLTIGLGPPVNVFDCPSDGSLQGFNDGRRSKGARDCGRGEPAL